MKITPKNYSLLLIALAAIGLIWFLIRHDVIVILPRTRPLTTKRGETIKKIVPVYLFRQGAPYNEQVEVVWPEAVEDQVYMLVQAWTKLLESEGVCEQKVTLQDVTATQNKDTFFISFDRPPFNPDSSTQEKWQLLESLLTTIRTSIKSAQASVHFLVHHQPLVDAHLDCTYSWPIEGFSGQAYSASGKIERSAEHPLTILLDPAGDARSPGRVIEDTFERGITLQFAQALKEALEKELPGSRIILTRFPGETIEPLQNAAFSNRLHADLYCGFSFYQHPKPASQVYTYFYLRQPTTDFWRKKADELTFVPYTEAYLGVLPHTAPLVTKYTKAVEQQAQSAQVYPAVGLPCKPLIGIASVALYTEIGIHEKDDWKHLVEPIKNSILGLIS